MNFPIPVVAEAGALQKALGLPAVKRAATHDFEKDKVTIRTRRLPTPTEVGSYALYYNPQDRERCVLNIYEHCEWQDVNGRYRRIPMGHKKIQMMGAAIEEDLNKLLEIYRQLDRKIDVVLRGKRSANEID